MKCRYYHIVENNTAITQYQNLYLLTKNETLQFSSRGMFQLSPAIVMISVDHQTQSQNLSVAKLALEDVHLVSKLALTERVSFMKCFEEKPEAIFLVVE